MDKNKYYIVTATSEEFTATNPVLKDDEIGKEIDTDRVKIGNGVTAWSDLDYFGEGGGEGGEAAYSIYTAKLTQAGTDNPVATILENSIGDIVWERTGVGEYTGTLLGAFPQAKRWMTPPCNYNFATGINVKAFWGSTSVIQISVDSAGTPEDSSLQEYAIEIRVYP